MKSCVRELCPVALVALSQLLGCTSKVVEVTSGSGGSSSETTTQTSTTAITSVASGGSQTSVSSGGPTMCDPGDIECAGACCDGACNAGVCTPITTVSDCQRLTPIAKPIAIIQVDSDYDNIAVTNGYVYYVSQGNVRRVPTSGGIPDIVSTTPIVPFQSALVASADVAFYQGTDGLDRATLGSPSTLLAAGSPSFFDMLALTSQDLIVSSYAVSAGPTSFSRVPQAGGPLTLLNVFPHPIEALTTFADAAYFVAPEGVFTLPTNGTAPVQLGSLDFQTGTIAADEDTIFATRYDPMSPAYHWLTTLDIATGATVDILPGLAQSWAVDDDAIFGIGGFSLNGTFIPSIFKLGKHQEPTTQNPPTVLASSALHLIDASSYTSGPGALAIDSQRIYFIEGCANNLQSARLVSLSKDFVMPNP